MRSKADETFVIVETLICPLQISYIATVLMNESFLSYECAQFTSQLRLRVLKSSLNITVDLSIVDLVLAR